MPTPALGEFIFKSFDQKYNYMIPLTERWTEITFYQTRSTQEMHLDNNQAYQVRLAGKHIKIKHDEMYINENIQQDVDQGQED